MIADFLGKFNVFLILVGVGGFSLPGRLEGCPLFPWSFLTIFASIGAHEKPAEKNCFVDVEEDGPETAFEI
jgi:hypothetical protein